MYGRVFQAVVGKDGEMKRSLAVPILLGFALLATAFRFEAQSNSKEEDRLYNSALVVREVYGYALTYTAETPGESEMFDCHAVRHQRSGRFRRKLRSWGHELPRWRRV